MDQRYTFLGFSETLNPWGKVLPYALLLSVTFALYSAALYFQFVWDDVLYVTQNYRIQGFSYPQVRAVWTGNYLGHYAPVQHTFLAILYHFFGMEPFGYHLGQLLIHAASVCLLYTLLAEMESPRIALLASLLFVVHPTNIETVAWISETKSTLAFLFFLLSLWSFLRLRAREDWRYAIPCGLFHVLSMMAKINTVVAPAIFLLWDYKQEGRVKRKRLPSLALFFLISIIFTGVHLASFYKSGQVLEGASYYGGPLTHLMNVPSLIWFYIRMSVIPYPLSAWHLFGAYAKFNWVVVGAWAALLAAVWILYKSGRTEQFWGLWFLIFLAPVLQLLPFGIWVADRYLYIPAIGAFVLASRGFFSIWDRLATLGRRAAWEAAMAAILLTFGWYTYHHLPVWRSDLALWEATTPTCNSSAYCHSNLGLALLIDGQTEAGVKELIRSVELRAAPRYLIHLGDAFTLSNRDYRQALIAYKMALQQPDLEINAKFYAKLARLYIRMGNWEAADQAIQAGAKIDANDPTLLIVNGVLRWREGNPQEAVTSLRRVLMITGQASNAVSFISEYWGDRAEVRRMFTELRASQASNR